MATDNGLELTVWVHRGNMLINHDGLDVNDPESWPSKWMEKFGEVDSFPWSDMYQEQARDAKRRFRMHFMGKHCCPHCGGSLEEE